MTTLLVVDLKVQSTTSSGKAFLQATLLVHSKVVFREQVFEAFTIMRHVSLRCHRLHLGMLTPESARSMANTLKESACLKIQCSGAASTDKQSRPKNADVFGETE